MTMRVLLALGILVAATFALLTVSRTPTARADNGGIDVVKVYKAQCATCHGVDGKGQTTAGKKAGNKDWTDGKTLKALTDDQIKKIIREGVKGKDGKQKMAAFKKLPDVQVDALIQYVRTFEKR
jgi:mono/diheme cytochrome c family protein